MMLRGRDLTGETLETRRDLLQKEVRHGIQDDEARGFVLEFEDAHERMSASYGQALAAFADSQGVEQAQADTMVKGQDRAPTDPSTPEPVS